MASSSTQNPRFKIIDPTAQPAVDPRITSDATTGLEWQTIPFPESMTWAEADAACKALRIGGYSDWRLPTLNELESIRDLNRCDPAINPEFFPDCPSSWFWSSTPHARNPAEVAWIVLFDLGGSNGGYRYSSGRVRAVRGPSRQFSASLPSGNEG